MPYISPERRSNIEQNLIEAFEYIDTKGDLCFAIYWLMKAFAEYPADKDVVGPAMTFDSASNAVSACECAKLEFYRRILAPYEDKKIEENGDVT